jgi:hypothetical protein
MSFVVLHSVALDRPDVSENIASIIRVVRLSTVTLESLLISLSIEGQLSSALNP